MAFSRGFVISVLRLLEPDIRNTICKRSNDIRSKTTIKLTKQQQEVITKVDDPNIVFLSSSINNILVCGLLKGMNMYLTNESDFSYQDFKQEIKIHFDSIEILDPIIFKTLSMKQINKLSNQKAMQPKLIKYFLKQEKKRNKSSTL